MPRKRQASTDKETPQSAPQEPRDIFLEKGLPQNLEAERSILGAVLLDNNVNAQMVALLKRDDFFLDSHRKLYDAMLALGEWGVSIDLITLGEHLRREGYFEQIGGATYISSLIDGVARTDDITPYAKIVKASASFRRVITECNLTIARAFDMEESPEALIAAHQNRVSDIARGVFTKGARSSGDIAYEYLAQVENMIQESPGARLLGVRSGFPDLDQITSGMRKQKLTILAARPGCGKTAALCQNSVAVASERKIPLLFSAEMSEEEIVERLLASISQIDSYQIRHGALNAGEWDRVLAAAKWLVEHPILIDDTPGLTIADVKIRSRKVRADYGLDWIGADYLQLFHATKRQYSREQEVSEVARGFKELAKELDVPVTASAQLSRNTENRSNHRPQLSDLRESGEIEQAADIVAFLYREEIYHQSPENEDIAELLIEKHRGGKSPWKTSMIFRKEWSKFIPLYSAALAAPQSIYTPEPEADSAEDSYEQYA